MDTGMMELNLTELEISNGAGANNFFKGLVTGMVAGGVTGARSDASEALSAPRWAPLSAAGSAVLSEAWLASQKKADPSAYRSGSNREAGCH